ncbi:TAXI family TRAP transporter solute-binding subunit [Pueribacillus sp. YX66]|uniref:TAXI family TRAP transporter solute-binding subunit n=1 Tax=Pueribacillus sp. YX66 TaxID=3229242 RepID=UPI00358D016B
MKKKVIFLLMLTSLFGLVIGCSGEQKESASSGTSSSDIELPEQIVMTTYDIGSSGYTQLSAISDAITKEFGAQIRMMPSASGLGRLQPLKDETALFGGRLADEVYFAFEGIEEFAVPQWGPQDITFMYPIVNQYGFLVLEDSKFETIEDLKGAKFPRIIGNPSINIKNEALLAAAGLTYDDVEVVEIASYGDQTDLLAQGKLDVATTVPSAAMVFEAAELHGVRWLDISIIEDDEALERLREIYPSAVVSPWDIGGALTKGEPEIFLGYTTYAPAAYRDVDANFVYNWLKALEATFDTYSQVSEDMSVWHYEESVPEPLSVPIHEGGVQYFKEKGLWNDEFEKKNNELIERQKKLKEAWETVVEESSEKGLSESEFPEYWLKRKAELLD